jgi:predicted RNA-binding protein
MCLSNVYVEKNGHTEKVMGDVSRMVTKDDGMLLIGMFGEEKFIQGQLKHTDFLDGESVIIGHDSSKT